MPNNPKIEALKNRISPEDARSQFGDFCASFQTMLLATVSTDGAPTLDNAIYRNALGEHMVLLTPNLTAYKNIEDGTRVGGMLLKSAPSDGPDLPFLRQSFKAQFQAVEVSVDKTVLQKFPVEDRKTVRHIINAHDGKLFQLKVLLGNYPSDFIKLLLLMKTMKSLGWHQAVTANRGLT